MTFEQFVNDTFIEHHNCLGVDLEEAQDLLDESTLRQRIKWLELQGYDLEADYNNLMDNL